MTQTQKQETGLTMIVTIVDIITSAKKINKGALVYLLHTHVGQKIKKAKTFHGPMRSGMW